MGKHILGSLIVWFVLAIRGLGQGAPNLVVDGGFENDGQGWAACGGVSVVGPADLPVPSRGIRQGGKAALLRVESGVDCGQFFGPLFELQHEFSIPSGSGALTVSFWHSRVSDPGMSISLFLQGTSKTIALGSISRNEPLGWSVFHRVLNQDEIAPLRGQKVKLVFAHPSLFSSTTVPALAPADPANSVPGFFIDNVRVADGAEPKPRVAEDPPSTAENLLPNGDFEQGLGFWELCGGDTGLVEAGEVDLPERRIRNGRKAMRLRYDLAKTCQNSFVGPNFTLGHRLAVPDDASELSITLWSSRLGDPGVNLRVELTAADGFLPVVSAPIVPRSGPTGWIAYHYALKPDELGRARGQVLRLRFSGSLLGSPGNGVGLMPDDPTKDKEGFYIDDIRVVAKQVPKPISAEDPTSSVDNLIRNGGFEERFKSWEICGSAALSEASATDATPLTTRNGKNALRLNPGKPDCGFGILSPSLIAGQSITVPADVPALTLSFWYSRVGDPGKDLWLKFAPEFAGVGGEVNLSNLHTGNLGGWSLYRYVLHPDQVDALRGKRVYFAFYYSLTSSSGLSPASVEATPGPPGFYIDDVRLAPRIERTTASPLPADLQGDNGQPLVLVNGSGIARMNPDGSGLRVVTPGAGGPPPLAPEWSADGKRILFHQAWLVPEDLVLPVDQFRAKISIVREVPADGGALRELTRTDGTKGIRAKPLNCELGTPSFCADSELPALDMEVVATESEPNGQRVAYSICVRQRYFNGATDDANCWVQVQGPDEPLVVNPKAIKLGPGLFASWSKEGRILYQNHAAIGKEPQGIMEVDMNAAVPTPRLLVPDAGKQFQVSLINDANPVWSPDGRYFVTYRNVDGAHWEGSMELFQGIRSHKAIMLHDRLEPRYPRQLLLVDHGENVGWLEFSPDGRYVLYSLIKGGRSDIWWLDIASGATGPITMDGASIAAKWRPGSQAPSEPLGPARLEVARTTNTTLRFSLSASPGEYIIATSQDLRVWSDLFPLTVAASGRGTVEDPGSLGKQRASFYRARRKP